MDWRARSQPIVRFAPAALVGFVCLAATVGFVLALKSVNQPALSSEHAFVRFSDPVRTDLQRAMDQGAPDPGDKVKVTTIGQMLSLERPEELTDADSDFHGVRHGEFEHSIWTLDVVVESIILREDKDFYLVLRQDGLKVCAELPDPKLCRESKFYPQILAIREALVRDFSPSPVPKVIERRATITGLGFFGKPRQGLTRSNGARIYPLLRVDWR